MQLLWPSDFFDNRLDQAMLLDKNGLAATRPPAGGDAASVSEEVTNGVVVARSELIRFRSVL